MLKTIYDDVFHTERLYLYKDDKNQDIYVDLPILLPQHQVDGVRFLFRQFKKKHPGVILNDPSGYGKCLQVVLFIKAVRTLLKKPVFIMCDENNVENWAQHFKEWTDCFDDIAIKSPNPFTKKLIHINTIKEAYTFCRRDWSVVVIDDSSFSKSVLQAVFRADYKIWVTSVDMKDNLRTFSYIYEWLHPIQKFNFEDFIADKDNPRDVVNKSILLDAYLEDIVLRRETFWTPFKIPGIYQPSIPESPQKVTRKNKDPTGTKVKRSKKRKIEEEIEKDADINDKPAEAQPTVTIEDNKDSFDTSNWFNFENDKSSNDVESFIREQEPVTSQGFQGLSQESDNQGNIPKNKDNITKADEPNTMDFENAINDIVKNENRMTTDLSQDYIIENDSVDAKGDTTTIERKYSEVKEVNHKHWDFNKTTVAQDSKTSSANDVTKDCEGTGVPEKFDNNSVSIENGNGVAKDPLNGKSENNDKNPFKNVANNEESEIKVEIKGDLSNKAETDVVASRKSVTNIDIKLAELEAQALNKFKGSFLDRLF